VRHGIGTEAQSGVLLAAGADRLWTPGQVVALLPDKQIAPLAFRPEDTIVMVQPKLLTAVDMRRLSALTPSFEVLGHAPLDASKSSDLDKVRGLTPMADATLEPRKGGNIRYNQPNEEQAKVIVGYWHGSMPPREFMPKIEEMLDEKDLPHRVPRDWVKKWTGNTKRDPADPGKLAFNFNGHK